MTPAKFDTDESDKLILDEEDIVTSMYFIMQGKVGIGHYMLTHGLTDNFYHLMIECGVNQCICDYYVCADQKSEFIYVAIEDDRDDCVEAISLSKDFINEVFQKYPSIAYKIKKDSEHRYMINIRDVIN